MAPGKCDEGDGDKLLVGPSGVLHPHSHSWADVKAGFCSLKISDLSVPLSPVPTLSSSAPVPSSHERGCERVSEAPFSLQSSIGQF